MLSLEERANRMASGYQQRAQADLSRPVHQCSQWRLYVDLTSVCLSFSVHKGQCAG